MLPALRATPELGIDIMSNETTLEARNVSFSYGGRTILHNTNIKLHGGSVVGIVGPNGVGKTTLLSTLTGDLIPDEGEVLVNGRKVSSIVDRSRLFGLSMPTYGFSPSISVRAALSDLSRVLEVRQSVRDELMRHFGIDEFANKKIGKLSTGMRKKFELVVASMTGSRILILDEPTNGLDVESVELLREFIKSQKDDGVLVLISSHAMAELDSMADCIIGIHDGQVKVADSFQPGIPGSAEASYKSMMGHSDETSSSRKDQEHAGK